LELSKSGLSPGARARLRAAWRLAKARSLRGSGWAAGCGAPAARVHGGPWRCIRRWI